MFDASDANDAVWSSVYVVDGSNKNQGTPNNCCATAGMGIWSKAGFSKSAAL